MFDHLPKCMRFRNATMALGIMLLSDHFHLYVASAEEDVFCVGSFNSLNQPKLNKPLSPCLFPVLFHLQ